MTKRIVMAIIFVFLSVSYAQAGQIDIAWDQVTDPSQVGIRVYVSTTSGGQTIGSGWVAELPITATSYMYTTANDGTYFVVVTSIDVAGLDSGTSNECSKVISTTPQNVQCN